MIRPRPDVDGCTLALAALAAVVGAIRLWGVTGGVFQAFAHMFVGCMLGSYLSANRRPYLWIALALSALEAACFLAGVGH